jgi:hypothetical protein
MGDVTDLAQNSETVKKADRSVGSRECKTAVAIVSDAANLYIETNVPSRDVNCLKVGEDMPVELEAQPSQKCGTLR